MRAQFALRSEAFERALDHARRAGDEAQAGELLRVLGVSWTFGPLHVDEAIRKCGEALAQVRGNPRSEASFLGLLGPLHAMRGEFDQARALSARARAVFEEFSLFVGIMFVAETSWNIEMLAGNPGVAEQVTRRGYEELERAGEKAWLSTNAAELAQSLFALGRDEEAEHFTRISEEAGASDDVVTQVLWRQVRAKVLARSGDLGQAERLAREAVRLSEESDAPNWRGDALLDLAEVLRLAGRPAEAVAPVEDALALYEQKGNAVSAAKARALLEELSASAPAS
jgi:ATP/maltotriose-dependent transcriptional regulator MalT